MAEEHVRMHSKQREEANMYINMAAQDYLDKKLMIEAINTLTMDIGQNENISSLGGDQCGDFLYMSPLIELICGIVDNAGYFMDVFMGGESTANQSADNIVLCLDAYFLKRLE